MFECLTDYKLHRFNGRDFDLCSSLRVTTNPSSPFARLKSSKSKKLDILILGNGLNNFIDYDDFSKVEDLYNSYIDKDEFIQGVISADGYGNTLSSYDGNVEEVTINNQLFYVMRTN